jgi:hypothetical protein
MLCSQLNPYSEKREVTLICFGAQSWIETRFTEKFKWEDVMPDPLVLFHIVFEELYLQFDSATWRLNNVFGDMEMVSLI